MLRFTHHPLVDVGVAVIMDKCSVSSVEEITDQHLEKFSQYLEETYQSPYFKSYLSALFPNSAYVNPTMKTENRKKELAKVLYGYLEKDQPSPYTCVFCGQPARFRAFRQHIPLLTGEGMFNFFPRNRVGLETCPYCLLAIQSFPLGSLKVAGRSFFVHADDERLLLQFVKRIRKRNEKNSFLQDAKLSIDGKYVKTLFFNELLEVDKERAYRLTDFYGSITVYHLTNYGTKADIGMYYLPAQVLSLVYEMQMASNRRTWNQLVQDGWRMKKAGRQKDETEEQPNAFIHQNGWYEDLFDLTENPYGVIRFHLLGGIRKQIRKFVEQAQFVEDLNYWGISEIILKGVIQMKLDRVEKTRQLADKIADFLYIAEDAKLYKRLIGIQRNSSRGEYDQLRNLLIRFNRSAIEYEKRTGEKVDLPVEFDEFIEVFEQWEDTYSGNWRLGRDLVILRVMERLYQRNWFIQNEIEDEELAGQEE